ncbi:Rv0361 family membrane protein [Nocardia rhizosphaerae]|uniref:Mce-associated membrane protein n=1 Tax=Nocardia rhizosphaerae TaxID=1691571 RepID=A0ABV8L2P7_9NOCA
MSNPPGEQPPFGQQPPQLPSGPPGYPHAGFGQEQAPPSYPDGPDVLPPPQVPKPKRTGLFIVLGVVGLVVFGAILTGVVLTLQGRTPLSSDEKQIEVAVRDFYDTLDDEGFVAASALACEADRREIETLTPEQRRQFESASVSVTIDKVDDIVVTGDTAKATVVGTLTLSVLGEEPNTEDSTEEHLKKENGTWKICSVPATRR